MPKIARAGSEREQKTVEMNSALQNTLTNMSTIKREKKKKIIIIINGPSDISDKALSKNREKEAKADSFHPVIPRT